MLYFTYEVVIVFNRTTSFIFNKYGEIISELNQRHDKLIESTIRLKEKYIREYMSFDKDVYIQVQQGIVMLVVSMDEEVCDPPHHQGQGRR